MAKPTFTEKDARKYRKSLVAMVREAQVVIAYLDMIGKASADNKTGAAIAAACNKLEFAADYHRHFTLGEDLKPKRAVAQLRAEQDVGLPTAYDVRGILKD